MRATVQGKLIRAVVKQGEGKSLITGGFYQAPDDGRIETVEFYGDPVECKGLIEVPEGTLCAFDVTANARASRYDDSAYLSVKLHGFHVVPPERAASRS